MTAVSQGLPDNFKLRMEDLLGDELPAFLASLDLPRVRGLRLNPAKVSAAELARLLGLSLEPVPWCPAGYIVPADAPLGGHPAHLAGLYYLQEPSSMSVAEVLNPQPGWTVADVAASPGGKTTHLSALVGDAGLVVANETVGGRLRPLHDNLDLWGSRNVLTMSSPVSEFAAAGRQFDGVLLDAPCSGEGLFRRDPASIREWSPAAVRGSARRQGRLLAEAARLVRPGGVLVYSTCTFEVDENEQVVAQFLESASGWVLEEGQQWPGFRPGKNVSPIRTDKAVRLWPHCVSGEGQFFARLRRAAGDDQDPGASRHARPARAADRQGRKSQAAAGAEEAPVRESWREFHSAMSPQLHAPADRLFVRNDQIFLVPPHVSPSDPSVSTSARPGLPLGRARPGRFEPHPALARALAASDAENSLPLELDDPALAAFLRGETVPSGGADGWVLVCLEGRWGLGWAKRSHGVLKNMVPPATRLQAGRWAARR